MAIRTVVFTNTVDVYNRRLNFAKKFGDKIMERNVRAALQNQISRIASGKFEVQTSQQYIKLP